MTLEDEIDAFMKANIEQSKAWNDLHAPGAAIDVRALTRILSVTMGIHREAILRLAREIDNITGRK